jgi:hypothetical protein
VCRALWEPKDFSVYSAKALAMIDNACLPDTSKDRSITLAMQRKRPDETVERLRTRVVGPWFGALRERIEAWADTYRDALADADPVQPDGLSDRMEEAWEPLFAIADLAAGEWPSRAREAAVALYAQRKLEDDNVAVVLLAVFREVLRDRDAIATVSDQALGPPAPLPYSPSPPASWS